MLTYRRFSIVLLPFPGFGQKLKILISRALCFWNFYQRQRSLALARSQVENLINKNNKNWCEIKVKSS